MRRRRCSRRGSSLSPERTYLSPSTQLISKDGGGGLARDGRQTESSPSCARSCHRGSGVGGDRRRARRGCDDDRTGGTGAGRRHPHGRANDRGRRQPRHRLPGHHRWKSHDGEPVQFHRRGADSPPGHPRDGRAVRDGLGRRVRVLLGPPPADPEHRGGPDGPARVHLRRRDRQVAACRVRRRVQLMATYRLFPSTGGPSTAVAYTGDFTAGVVFQVSKGGCWFEGYLWGGASNGSNAAQKFALWLLTGPSVGLLIPEATVTSGPLSAGWNYVPLPAPIPLSIGGAADGGGATYVAATGVNGNFPDTNGYFTTGGPAPAGVTNGPLMVFSDQSGSNPGPFTMPQGVFDPANSDPTAGMPANGSASSNFWMDLQVSDTAPAGYAGSYRLWPTFANVTNDIAASNHAGTQTTGTMFSLSQPCLLNNVWLYSPAGVTGLPASTQIWDTATQSLVPGTNVAATWSGMAGGGWIANGYSALGIVLPAGLYIARVS